MRYGTTRTDHNDLISVGSTLTLLLHRSMTTSIGIPWKARFSCSRVPMGKSIISLWWIMLITCRFRHDSIPTAVKSLQAWGPYYNVSFDATEDQSLITTENLAQYDCLMFVHTSGDSEYIPGFVIKYIINTTRTVFDATGQAAFQDYLAKGGNFAAVHAASTTFMLKPWMPWTETLGATFLNHPNCQTAAFVKEMKGHPATNDQPD